MMKSFGIESNIMSLMFKSSVKQGSDHKFKNASVRRRMNYYSVFSSVGFLRQIISQVNCGQTRNFDLRELRGKT